MSQRKGQIDLSCTLIESHVLIGCCLHGMNSYYFLEKQRKSYPFSGDDVYPISPLGQPTVHSHITSWASKHISYPFLGNRVYLHIHVYIFIFKVQDKYVIGLKLHEYENT